MKANLLMIVAVAGFVVMLTSAATAQNAVRYAAEIPFGFTVGGRDFEAGKYEISRLNPNVAESGIVIRNIKSGDSAVFSAISSVADADGGIRELTFRRYGDRYFLSQIVTPTLEARFKATKTERSLAKVNRPQTAKVNLVR